MVIAIARRSRAALRTDWACGTRGGGGQTQATVYRGELRNGQTSGVGVYEFADNSGNAAARAARYEGEHAGDSASGHGIMYWKSGDNFAGLGAGGGSQARGVVNYANGQRYEGEMANGDRHGQGVVWAADGSFMQGGGAGREEISSSPIHARGERRRRSLWLWRPRAG